MWQQAAQPYIESGKLTAIGVVQEQHPDRTRLYQQWRQLGWPIFVDSLNVLDLKAVPIPVAIDEWGMVRDSERKPKRFAEQFMNAEFEKTSAPASYHRAKRPDVDRLRRLAQESPTAKAWRDLGDACFLWRASGAGEGCHAVEAYEKAVALDPHDGRAQFRLGVALRRRYESRNRHPSDAQAAVERWGLALSVNPNQYVWRRRIQQYGPRLDKPYNFYSWVDKARKEITARGEVPLTLVVEPTGSEVAPPERSTAGTDGSPTAQVKDRRPQHDRIHRDTKSFVRIEPMVAPVRARPGHRVRARITFRVNERTRPYWNNEADDLAMWVDLPDGLTLGEGKLFHDNPQEPETQEDRAVEFEIAVDKNAKPATIKIPAYALYYVCENKGGKCHYVRQDFTVTFHVDPNAPKIR